MVFPLCGDGIAKSPMSWLLVLGWLDRYLGPPGEVKLFWNKNASNYYDPSLFGLHI